MKPTAYRIKRTKLADADTFDGNHPGHVAYLQIHISGGRKYGFKSNPRVCLYCKDYHEAIDFPTAAAAKRQLRSSAVRSYFAPEISWVHDGYKVEVVELRFEECDETNAFFKAKAPFEPAVPAGHHVVVRERVVWPVPPVLDRLAAIE